MIWIILAVRCWSNGPKTNQKPVKITQIKSDLISAVGSSNGLNLGRPISLKSAFRPLVSVGMKLDRWISIGSCGCHPSAPSSRPSDQDSVKTARWISQNSQIALRGPCASPVLRGPLRSSTNQSAPPSVKFLKSPSIGPPYAAKNADVILTSALHRWFFFFKFNFWLV